LSFNEGIEVKLHKRRVLDGEIVGYLINNLSCLDNKPQKEEAYQIAINFFTSKQQESKCTDNNGSVNWAEAIKLGVLIDEYTDADGEKRKTYAMKIAQYLLDAPKFFLTLIPDEIKGTAFNAVIQYLEEQMSS